MSDSPDAKKVSIPSWQRQSPPAETTESEPQPDESPKEAPPPSRAALLEQASRFLQEDDIREASTARKISFLETKGLTNDEISKLIGVSRNTDSSSSSPPSPSPPQEPKTMDTQGNNHSPQRPPPSSQPPPPSPVHPQEPSPIPPIITYPEFLLHSHPPKPPPLLTPRVLLSTLYLSSALAASLYGLSKYVLAPMTSALTSARHELAETAITDLSKLNAKLETIVSEIPPDVTRPQHATGTAPEDDGEESEDEDPTELFHRDIGTQTSSAPTLSRRHSSSSASSTSPPSTPGPSATTPLTTQTTALRAIHTHLSSLLTEHSTLAATDESVKDRIADLQAYLDGLAYSSPSYVNSSVGGVYGMYGSGTGGGGSGGWSSGGGGGKGGGGVEEDVIVWVKAEIRGVKGVLLSARNFPGSAGGTGRIGGGEVRAA